MFAQLDNRLVLFLAPLKEIFLKRTAINVAQIDGVIGAKVRFAQTLQVGDCRIELEGFHLASLYSPHWGQRRRGSNYGPATCLGVQRRAVDTGNGPYQFPGHAPTLDVDDIHSTVEAFP